VAMVVKANYALERTDGRGLRVYCRTVGHRPLNAALAFIVDRTRHTEMPKSRFGWILLGMVTGTIGIVVADVHVSVASINPTDPSTYPNMAPQIRYLFIPVLFVPVLCFAAGLYPLLNWLFGPIRKPTVTAHILLGLCYSGLLASLPLGVVLPRHPASLLVGPVFAFFAAAVPHRWLSARGVYREC
jgi:hypothetical protein